MQAERTRWFSALREPPVNGSANEVYESFCARFEKPGQEQYVTARTLRVALCPGCQWRGLTARGVRQWIKGAR